MKNFEERKKEFEDAMIKLQNEYKIGVYAANIVFDNGEVKPVVKVADLEQPKEEEKLVETVEGEVIK